MLIRRTQTADLDAVMGIYARARDYMAEQGNPHQWGDIGWPPREVIEQDIAAGKSYVCEHEGRLAAVFYYDRGHRVDPCYDRIEGAWVGDEDYGVVHRIAAAASGTGAGRAAIAWAIEQSAGHLRMDTHEDNAPMRGLLESMGFIHCGTIYVREDPEPRRAYEHIGSA